MLLQIINITAIEYYRYDLIVCIEYENINDPNHKILKIIRNDDFNNNFSNIFDFESIPTYIRNIYDYSKTVSKILNNDGKYYICGQKIHKRDDVYYELIYDNDNPLRREANEINTNSINCINKDDARYYNNVLCTIKLKCY